MGKEIEFCFEINISLKYHIFELTVFNFINYYSAKCMVKIYFKKWIRNYLQYLNRVGYFACESIFELLFLILIRFK